MCTLSFLPTRSGYVLAMNRDEQRSRALALPPTHGESGGIPTLCPSEPGGGTWIGVNARGLSVALLNWYEKPQTTLSNPVSRGTIVPHLLAAENVEGADARLEALALGRIRPFRAVMVDPEACATVEIRWDGAEVGSEKCAWERRHWFSSGCDEPGANRIRGSVCAAADWSGSNGAEEQLLRRLHAGHDPERGAFSICMHRPDARTVSYTEVRVSGEAGEVDYRPGPPCEEAPLVTQRLERWRVGDKIVRKFGRQRVV